MEASLHRNERKESLPVRKWRVQKKFYQVQKYFGTIREATSDEFLMIVRRQPKQNLNMSHWLITKKVELTKNLQKNVGQDIFLHMDFASTRCHHLG